MGRRRGDTADAVAERRERILELTRQGLSARQIADKLRVCRATVHNTRRAAGVGGSRGVLFSAEEVTRIEAMLDDGASLREVSRTVGRSSDVLRRRFPGRGWTNEQAIDFMLSIRGMPRL